MPEQRCWNCGRNPARSGYGVLYQLVRDQLTITVVVATYRHGTYTSVVVPRCRRCWLLDRSATAVRLVGLIALLTMPLIIIGLYFEDADGPFRTWALVTLGVVVAIYLTMRLIHARCGPVHRFSTRSRDFPPLVQLEDEGWVIDRGLRVLRNERTY